MRKVKEVNKRSVKLQAYFEIWLMVISVFAFAFIFSLPTIFAEEDVITKQIGTFLEGTTTKVIDGGTYYLNSKGETIGFVTKDGKVMQVTDPTKFKLPGSANTPVEGTSKLSQILGLETGDFADSIVSGAEWAGIAYLVFMNGTRLD
jgi:hypothetical protein